MSFKAFARIKFRFPLTLNLGVKNSNLLNIICHNSEITQNIDII